MTIVTLHASGDADPDEAWERYAVPEQWAGWSPQISRVESSSPRVIAGMTGRVYGPAGVFVSFVVDDVDEHARRWAWTVRLGPLHLHLRHSVTARPDGGAATSLQLDGPLPVVLGYSPLAQYALHRLVRR